MSLLRRTLLIVLSALLLPTLVHAQADAPPVNPQLLEGLTYRMVGPYRGGRSTAVAGIAGQPTTFYMGTTGGGVWKSDDSGTTWSNISDGFFGGSIGAIDVADSAPSTIYVGTGSACIRGNTSHGHGAWKSVDGGKTWHDIGLHEAGQIGAMVVHPQDADVVYVAALGHAFGKNEMRGVYRSTDGGESWSPVLALSDSTGAVSLTMNPHNPRELFAGAWHGERKPWTLHSGSLDGGVYHSTDGGDTWTHRRGGLPTGLVGKTGVSLSPANPSRVWAILEAEPNGGLYRSDDGGTSWKRVNSENRLRQRAWYYNHVIADPQDENTVYVLNTRMLKSVDGGKTFEVIEVPHGDVHDLWINPMDNQRMVVANDGGAQVSVNGGRTWTSYYNQPTAELYGVVVDHGFPYRLYGSQQDNTGISVPAWSSNHTLYPKATWTYPGSCETGPVALHPDHPEITWGGCYGGSINRTDHSTDQRRNVVIYPQLQLGEAGQNLVHRFQWVAPIVVSPHDPNVVYHASQYVNRTTDGGLTWETISPDLTTNTPVHQDYSGGPINHDITGVEIFNTIFALTVSPHDASVIWAGSDDGRVHITRDGGNAWTDVTPRAMPKLGTVNAIEVSPHRPGEAYMAVHRYRMDDMKPYIFHTADYGATWHARVKGIPADQPVRVVREDPDRAGLLYAGTEQGLFVSLDQGNRWQPMQLNLPETPVTDLRVVHQDLAISTQGRSFWILDDVTPLHQLTDAVAAAPAHLFAPRPAYRVNKAGSGEEFAPTPAPNGATIYYHLADSAETVTLDVLGGDGQVARSFSSDSAAAKTARTPRLKSGAGMHRITWDLTYAGPDFIDGMVLWGFTGGVKAAPGTYQVRLTAGNHTATQALEVRPDPRLDVPQADYEAQFTLARTLRDQIDAMLDALRTIEDVQEQVKGLVKRAEKAEAASDAPFFALADTVLVRLTEVEQDLHQTKNESNQDPIRFAPRLDNQYLELYGNVTGQDGYISGGPEGRPTAGAYVRLADLDAQWTHLKAHLDAVLRTDVPALNAAYEALSLPPVVVPKPLPMSGQ